ncbi:MAG: hypothetical protein ACRER3_26540, partial [Pseudomonas fluorescens]
MSLLISGRPDHGVNHCARLSNTFTPAKLNALSIAIVFALPSLADATETTTAALEQDQLQQFNTSFLQGAQSSVDLQLLLS